ncbi:MAG: YdbL family protein [Desulfatitalea sp.]|nr:YdbL family protein [Desulfatitalea sp.]
MALRRKGFLILLVMVAGLVAGGTALADNLKTRMLERLPTILDLKTRGVVGENNQGFLEVLQGQSEGQDVVAAENQDRRSVYEQIARQTNTGIQIVGQRRALQIADRATPGEWLQAENGNWYQKEE